MSKSSHFLLRIIGLFFILGPLCIMVVLTITVLLPTIKDPESKVYGSSIGYPALKRRLNQPIKVQTVTVREMVGNERVAAPVESVALQEVDVRPLVSGMVEKVYVVEGQLVSKGEPLLKINQTPFENEVNLARNDLTIAEADLQSLPQFNRELLRELYANVESAKKKLALTSTDLQTLPQLHRERLIELKANVETAKTQLALAESKLSRFRILQQSGAISHLEISNSQENYITRKQELVTAKQELAQARLDMNLELNQTKKEYAEYQNELISAQQELAQTQSSIKQELKTNKLDVENSQIDLRKKIRDLKNTIIYASIDGLVSHVNIHGGETSSVENSVITLTKDVVFKAYIDQARLNSVKIGTSATVRLVAYPGQSFQGKVIQLNPTVETDVPRSSKVGVNRQYTYSAWIQVDKLQIPPGLQGYAQFGQNQASLVIPERALTHLSAGEGMVMIAEEGQAVLRKVKVGRKFDNQREVIEGLQSGEKIVLYPRYLNPGDMLKPQIFSENDVAEKMIEKNTVTQIQSSSTQKNTQPLAESTTSAPVLKSPNPFAEAVSLAENAAKAGQTANSSHQWLTIAANWQRASALMELVTPNHSHYSTAQNRVSLYRKNSKIAQQKARKNLESSQSVD